MALAMRTTVGLRTGTHSGTSVARSRPALRPLPLRTQKLTPVKAIELDFSDPDTQLSLAGLVLGLVAGLGAPIWYINRAETDEERLEELRALNRANFEETGEYMSDEEIARIRKPKWTDRREWVDDD